jgi:NADH-quinone oxidoreductase subunit J
MSDPRILLFAALIGGLGLWLMLPRGRARGRAVGVVLGAVSLGIFATALPGLPDWVAQSVFWVLAVVAIVSAAAAMTLRSPVYCAIWFGLSLLGTSGLFFLQGAQFLAMATVVVYAGAILVTFLFILMLAQPSGHAHYDRVSWEGLLSAACGAFLVGVLSMTVTSVLASPQPNAGPAKPAPQAHQQVVLSRDHMKQIGGQLFSRYLVAVEVTGTLLLAALVGAAVIVGKTRGPLVSPGPGRAAGTERSEASGDMEPGALRDTSPTIDPDSSGGPCDG